MKQPNSPPPPLRAGPETPAQLKRALRALGKQDTHTARLDRVANRLGDLLDAPPPAPFKPAGLVRHAGYKVLATRLVIAALTVGTTTAVWLARTPVPLPAPSAQVHAPIVAAALPVPTQVPIAEQPAQPVVEPAASPRFAASNAQSAASVGHARAESRTSARHARVSRRLAALRGAAHSGAASTQGGASQATGPAGARARASTALHAAAPQSKLSSPAESPAAESPGPTAAPDAPPPAPAEPRVERPLTEVELLFEARQNMKRNPRAALDLLDEHATRFGDGLLAPEREVLGIEALRKLGQARAAAQRLRSFRERYPDSLHLRRLDRLSR